MQDFGTANQNMKLTVYPVTKNIYGQPIDMFTGRMYNNLTLSKWDNKMNSQSNVVYLETLITIPDTAAVSEDTVTELYEAVVAIKQKMEAQKLYFEKGIEILKKYMGDSDVLVSKDGRRLATWKQQYKQVLNEDLLKKNFPKEFKACCKAFDIDLLKEKFTEEYQLCCESKEANKPFCLK